MTMTYRTWLTQEAFGRLREELVELIGYRADHGRADKSDEDLLLEAGHRQARIRQLQELLRDAIVGEAPPDDGIAEPGMVVTVRFDDEEETEVFLLGVRDGADLDGLEVCSPGSPVGAALLGALQGEERSYAVPTGGVRRVLLVRAVPYNGP